MIEFASDFKDFNESVQFFKFNVDFLIPEPCAVSNVQVAINGSKSTAPNALCDHLSPSVPIMYHSLDLRVSN